ncbi:probable benomyl/methotrexate resistance protein [Rhynchosporium secalis]|uniref:Probable benomyl/methotrexate resistance protein n=1 Tax=Rhynchosporium secalis TaxID=38038 RepID=A0A1E1M2F9_RHYSE|nr:probable benomyl/methotrexate resistance protein [Rhynchosporium secalis]
MAEASEKTVIEKSVSGERSPTDESCYDLPPTKECEPIGGSGEAASSRPNTLGRNRTGGSVWSNISRTRTHNGYGCDENGNEEGSGQDAERGVEEKDPFEVVWDGGDMDPLNPRSMSKGRKWLVVIIVSLSSLCVTCTSSIYTLTYGQITEEFHCSRIVATLGLSFFIMGLGLGPMLLGPLSEFYGRRPIYWVSFTMFLIWIIPSAVAKNIQTMLVARFFDGLSGSAFLSVAGGTVGDMFNREQLQLPMLIYTASPFVGPSLGPLIGGFINQYIDWRWTFYVLLIWSGANLGMIMLFVPETYHPILLRNKARKLRQETGDEKWKSSMERNNKSIPKTIALSLQRPFQLLFLEPMVLNLCLFSAILLGILYLFFGAFPLVFTGNHGFSLSQVGLSFLGIFVGMVLAATTDPIWHKNYARLIRQREERTGEVGGSEPEYRLPPSICGAVLVPSGLFMFAWTTYSSVHWIVPIIGSTIFGMGTLLVFSGIFTFLVDAYPLYAASSLAANSFARSSFAAAFPLFGIQMYHTLGDQWATSLLAFLTLAMAPFPYIFFVYGKRIRGTSRFATA